MIDIDSTISVLETEKTCVLRQNTPSCDRKCEKCDLLLPTKQVLDGYNNAIDVLKSQKRGHWVEDNDYLGYNIYSCSECGKPCMYHRSKYTRSAYCPWCGALMDNPEERKV